MIFYFQPDLSKYMGEATESAKQEGEIKFGNGEGASLDTVKKAPEETQQQFHSVSTKGDSLKMVGAEVLSCKSKDDLKTNLPKAIVVKKNLKKLMIFLKI